MKVLLYIISITWIRVGDRTLRVWGLITFTVGIAIFSYLG